MLGESAIFRRRCIPPSVAAKDSPIPDPFSTVDCLPGRQRHGTARLHSQSILSHPNRSHADFPDREGRRNNAVKASASLFLLFQEVSSDNKQGVIVPRYALRLLDAFGGDCPTSPKQVSTCTCGE